MQIPNNEQFHKLAKGDVRPHNWACQMSFTKEWDDETNWFELDNSKLNSVDILAPYEATELQAWDFYKYENYSNRLVYAEWERKLNFPYSISTARADFALVNTDDYFTPTLSDQFIARNHSTNPSFEAWSGTPDTVVRTNLLPNPTFATGITSWGRSNAGFATGSTATDTDFPSGKAWKMTSAAAAAGVGIFYKSALSLSGTWTGMIYVKHNHSSALSFRLGTSGVYKEVSVPPNTATEISDVFNLTTGAISVMAGTTPLPAGVELRFSSAKIEVANKILPYFDGSYSADVDFRVPSWTGAANNSISVLKIAGTSEVRSNLNPNPRMVGDTNGVANGYILYSQPTSTATASKPSANIQRLHQTTATASGAISQLSIGNIAVSANTTYTAQVKVTELSLSGSTIQLMWEEYSGTTWVVQGSAVNITGEGVFSITGTTSATTNVLRVRVRVISTGTSPDSYVDFTNFCLEKIGVLLPYFDGSTNTWQAPDLAPKWTGAVDNSTSVLVGVKPVNYALDAANISRTWLSTDSPNHGKAFARKLVLAAGGNWSHASDTAVAEAGFYTLGHSFRVSRAQKVTSGAIDNGAHIIVVPEYDAPEDEWQTTTFSYASTSANVAVSLRAVAQIGDLIDLDNHFVIKGDYTGEYFDGNTANYDKYMFSWEGEPNDSTSVMTKNVGKGVSAFVRPKRPVKLYSGLGNTLLPQFVGLTQGMPETSEIDSIVQFTALDFLTQIYEMPIRDTLAMSDVRTDQVLANIFQQFGLTPSQYELSQGKNKIPFLFFEKDQTVAGDVIKDLIEAEMGKLWLDEKGVIQFRNRDESIGTLVYTFDKSEIVNVGNPREDDIINTIVFNSEIRRLADWQNIYTKTEDESPYVVMANSTNTFEFGLKDPCLDVVLPTRGENSGVSWFVARNSSGTIVGNVSATKGELKTNSYDVTFSNTNNYDINIADVVIYGHPAKVAYPITKTVDYPPSIEMFGTKELIINNNFLQSETQMDSLAIAILRENSNYAYTIDMEVKGNHALELYDKVAVDFDSYTGTYRIIGIESSLKGFSYVQKLKLRKLNE